MYILLCGFPPFGGQTDDQILKKIAVGRFGFPSPEWDNISYEAKDLITKMLNFDHSRRISAQEALQHSWLTNASKAQINPQLVRTLFQNLKTFRTERKLQKATLSYIISQLSTSKDREEMLELFKTLDKDGNGTLSKSELVAGFHRIYGNDIEDLEEEVDKIMVNVDANRSGEIDYSEFVVATMNRQKLLSREKLEAAFKAFDLDNSGTISADELKTVLGRFHSYDDSIWQEIIKEVDTNGDGVIDLREFTEMMLKVG